MIPRSVKTARTNDEVKASPAATWSSTWCGRARRRRAGRRSTLSDRAWQWQVGDHTGQADATRQARHPGEATAQDGDQARPDQTLRLDRSGEPPLPCQTARSTCTATPTGSTGPGSGTRPTEPRSRLAPVVAQSRRPTRDTEIYSRSTPPPPGVAANFGAVELHPWTSTTHHPHQPTWAMVDIDPGESTTFDDVMALATLHRTVLAHIGVDACPKLTGRRGIQIWIPVASRYTFDDTRAWVERLSWIIGTAIPDLVSWEWQKSKRKGLARLDYTQNVINKTLVAPFKRAGARPTELRFPCRSAGMSSTTRICAPTAGSARSVSAWPTPAIRSCPDRQAAVTARPVVTGVSPAGRVPGRRSARRDPTDARHRVLRDRSTS